MIADLSGNSSALDSTSFFFQGLSQRTTKALAKTISHVQGTTRLKGSDKRKKKTNIKFELTFFPMLELFLS